MKRNVYLMYLIVFLQGFVFYAPIATIYREARGVTISDIFIMESIFFLLMILLEVPWGYFADKFGYKKTLILSNFLFFLSKIIFWKATGFSGFLLERVLLAISLAGLSGCDEALLYLSIDEENSEKVFGKYSFYANGGFFLSSVLSMFIINISMEASAFLTIIPYGIASIVTLFLIDKREEVSREVNLKENLKLAIKNKSFIVFIVSFALIEEVVQSITVFLNQGQYIRSGIAIKYFGIILAVQAIVRLISAKSYKVSGKLGQNKALIILSFVISIIVGILIFTYSPMLSILFIMIVTGASQLMVPMIIDIKNKAINTGDRATMLSIYSLISSIVAISINPVIGFSANISLETGILSCFIISALGSLLMLRGLRK